ncbi:MAG TPA: dihydroxyacetone kinase subunit DhaL [Bryobacteraceae bacterium]|jgi:dihydroxyacetone kinase|nr:dihydroxyacetone kinase subunit DhaL [Bryobacteraceae bacterium]
MRKLINDPARIIDEMVDGLIALNPNLARLAEHYVVVRADADAVRDRQVALISGGGSGHEPAHAGYVGPGMLTAAVAGEIFTSPSVDSIVAAIRTVTGRLGALLIVKNYTGDRLNFGMAAEMARAEGLLVDTVVVADDVALLQSQDHAGRRGLAGTIFVHKIAGAAAAAGLDLPQVATLARAAAAEVGTMGVALSGGSAPTLDRPAFALEDEVELGLGIHGERGVSRIASAPANELLDHLVAEVSTAMRLTRQNRVAVLLNNLGSTTGIEMAIAARRVIERLRSQQIEIERLYAGPFLTSLDMAGLSISLLRVDDERLKWLDASTSAPAWPRAVKQPPGDWSPILTTSQPENTQATPRISESEPNRRMVRILTHAADALSAAENKLTELDRAVGDGDLGQNMARAAASLRAAIPFLPLDNSPALLKAIGRKLQHVLGGSSGPLYGVLFLRAGTSLEGASPQDAKAWATALLEGTEAIAELGGARLGDSTMLDALVPFARTLLDRLHAEASTPEALLDALAAARSSAENTTKLLARRGRASYLGKRSVGHPDPGAIAAVIWLEAVVESVLD